MPNKIFLCGPPAVGKTYFGKKYNISLLFIIFISLASDYNIPYICLKDIVEKAKV